jgi:hypothetical protein
VGHGPPLAYDYVWEGFFPPAKRRWGYYVLPIVYGDRFVGRIEPRIDRDRARVEALNVWWGDGLAPRRADGFVEAMRGALSAYLGFADADRLEWAPQSRNGEAALPHPPVTEARVSRSSQPQRTRENGVAAQRPNSGGRRAPLSGSGRRRDE